MPSIIESIARRQKNFREHVTPTKLFYDPGFKRWDRCDHRPGWADKYRMIPQGLKRFKPVP